MTDRDLTDLYGHTMRRKQHFILTVLDSRITLIVAIIFMILSIGSFLFVWLH